MGFDNFKNKVVVVTGAASGIGAAICRRFAREGARIGLLDLDAKGVKAAADKFRAIGVDAVGIRCDVVNEDECTSAMKEIIGLYGGIDVLVNNASAISLSGTLATELKRFDLMFQVNARGTFACSRACLPHLKQAANPHLLNISPPLNLDPRWFANHVAYTITKYGMSMCVLGMAEEFRREGVACNALWPKTAIATAAVANLLGGDGIIERCRTPEIMADAAYNILTRDSGECTGNFFLDEDVLLDAGVTDFSEYAVNPDLEPAPDFFV